MTFLLLAVWMAHSWLLDSLRCLRNFKQERIVSRGSAALLAGDLLSLVDQLHDRSFQLWVLFQLEKTECRRQLLPLTGKRLQLRRNSGLGVQAGSKSCLGNFSRVQDALCACVKAQTGIWIQQQDVIRIGKHVAILRLNIGSLLFKARMVQCALQKLFCLLILAERIGGPACA